MSKNALQSMIDGSHAKDREQTVLTPALILDPLRSVWGSIALDPCGPPCVSFVNAEHEIRLPRDGLAYNWIDRTYLNPEFAQLCPRKGRPGWLLHEHIQSGARIAWLVPVRTHRKWWRLWVRQRVDALIWLNPFPFVGHDQVFPAPLCLGYRGHDAAAIVDAFRDLGEPC